MGSGSVIARVAKERNERVKARERAMVEITAAQQAPVEVAEEMEVRDRGKDKMIRRRISRVLLHPEPDYMIKTG